MKKTAKSQFSFSHAFPHVIQTGYLGCLLLFCFSCGTRVNAPDVSDIQINPNLIRFEHQLADIDTHHMDKEVDDLSSAYSDFTDVFFYQIIADPRSGQDLYKAARYYLTDTFMQQIVYDCAQEYDDFSGFYQDLQQALKYFHYYFPDFIIPDIYTCVTGFQVGAFTIGDGIIGCGLDFYLGENYSKYDPSLFPEYIQRTMNREHLVAKLVQALVANYLGEVRGTTLLDYMIRNGIEIYIKEKLMPASDPAVVHEFTHDQLRWMQENEAQIWAHLLDNELLYSINYREFQKLISPSPNVPNMPPQAPGRVGNWMGYQIVHAYMERNKQATLSDLLDFASAQKILAGSKYKPRQSI